MLPRERIAEIVDPGTRFLELSALAAFGKYDGKVHSASMITGIGVVHGRECMFLCNDATVKGGVFFPETFEKYIRAQEIAEANLNPNPSPNPPFEPRRGQSQSPALYLSRG